MTSDQVYRACADLRKERNSAGDSQPPWRTEMQTIVQGSQLWSRWDEVRDTKCSRKKAEPGGWSKGLREGGAARCWARLGREGVRGALPRWGVEETGIERVRPRCPARSVPPTAAHPVPAGSPLPLSPGDECRGP